MTPDDDWLRTVARENEQLERARLIQPARGHPLRHSYIDLVVMVVILASLFYGEFFS